jgi:prophage regulatory protein
MKILSSNKVVELTGLSRVTLSRYEQAGTFPQRRQLGTRRVGWVESEILGWLESRPVSKEAKVQPIKILVQPASELFTSRTKGRK